MNLNDDPVLRIGDCAEINGLVNDLTLNGQRCEILTAAEVNQVPESDGVVRTKIRHGIMIIPSQRTGYIGPENLKRIGGPEMVRANWIHHTGMEGPE